MRKTEAMRGFECVGCGRCCQPKWYFQRLQKADIERFAGREDILKYVGDRRKFPVDENQKYITPCPFLKDNRCTIHDIKSDFCANFPISEGVIQGIGCKGILHKDKKIKKA